MKGISASSMSYISGLGSPTDRPPIPYPGKSISASVLGALYAQILIKRTLHDAKDRLIFPGMVIFAALRQRWVRCMASCAVR